jgi:DNA-directed RNA polymerase omega subunit
MMKDITSEKYLKNADNIYSLVIMAAKRSAALTRGEPSLLSDVRGKKCPKIALDEIAQGKITLALPPESHAGKKK